jgi:hypothetical protein
MEGSMRPVQSKPTRAAALALCLTLAACVPRAATTAPTPTETLPPVPTATSPPATPTATVTVAPDTGPESSCPALQADELDAMTKLEGEVSDLRGLSPRAPLQRELLDQTALARRVVQDLLSDYTEEQAAQDTLLYTLLGRIEPGVDLRQLYSDLLAEQAAGFYDLEKDEMILLCGTGFGGIERLTYVHEYDHTLVDQVFEPEENLDYSEAGCEGRFDRCLALQSLIEGDATLLQEQWLRTFGREQDLVDILGFFDQFEMPVFNSAPAYIQDELTFPYLQGLAFVRSLYLKDGWSGVDELYVHPPLSSEQILHPDRYPRDVPIELSMPDLEGLAATTWAVIASDTFGEWNTFMLLADQLEQTDARTGAEGWGGDSLVLLQDRESGDGALILLTQWDTIRDAREFFDAFRLYGALRFGEPSMDSGVELAWDTDGTSSLLVRHSNQTLWVLAPDTQARTALRELLVLPVSPAP